MALAATLVASCGGEEESELPPGHNLSQEDQDRVVAETQEDLEMIMAITPETIGDLSRAMSGTALEDTRKGIEDDLAQGRFRKRDYRNINIKFTQYMKPIATELIEFEDFGYYVDAKTGAQLTQPTGEKRAYSIYVVEEDGRWKIKGLFEPSNETTPREAPDELLGGASPQPTTSDQPAADGQTDAASQPDQSGGAE